MKGLFLFLCSSLCCLTSACARDSAAPAWVQVRSSAVSYHTRGSSKSVPHISTLSGTNTSPEFGLDIGGKNSDPYQQRKGRPQAA